MLAQTVGKRFAIAMRACYEQYFRVHPDGSSPGEVFIEEYMKPFIDCELEQRSLDDVHRDSQRRELELISELTRLRQLCVERINNTGGAHA